MCVMAAAAFSAPVPVYLRFAFSTDGLSAADASSAHAKLEHALFADSLIVQTKPDSVVTPGSPHRGLFLVRGRVEQRNDRLNVCLSILNVLLRPVVGPDTATIQPA